MNPHSLIRGLLACSAILYAGIGTWTTVDPIGALADVGVGTLDSRGLVELRAMYGGLQLGMAAFLAWCLATPERARVGLTAATLTIGGLGLVRTLSWLAIGPEGALLPLLCVVELGCAGLGAAALAWDARTA